MNRLLFIFSLLLVQPITVAAQSISDFGVSGIIDMPSARMQADGTFSTTINRQDSADIYNLSYQAFPWLETTFRYTIFDPREDFDTSAFNLRDRSYEAKILLFSEKRYRPAVAVGLRDLLGTGVFGGEYLVASKKWNNFDLTLGVGWGRLAGNEALRNPFTALSDSFDARNADTGLGGEFSLDNYFSGERIGVFGGFTYRIPKYNLTLLAEYNSDDYPRDVASGTLELDSRFSYGINWEIIKNIELGLSWQHGSELGIRLSSRIPSIIDIPLKVTKLDWQHFVSKNKWGEISDNTKVIYESIDSNDLQWARGFKKKLKELGLSLSSIKYLASDHIAIEYYNTKYTYQIDAVKLIYQQALIDLPANINNLTVINISNNYRQFSAKLPIRKDMTQKQHNLNHIELGNTLGLVNPDKKYPYQYPYVRWKGNFGTRFSLFAPEAPLRTQFNFKLGAKVSINESWSVHGSYVLDIANNFDNSTRRSNSVLPRVRSDINEYLEQGESGINALFVTKRGQFSPNTYYRAYGGILEEMFSGVGGEVLYRPSGSRFAYGLNLNYVFQRDFEKNFAHQDYRVFTGHASIYWASPFYNYDVALHMGQYLAGDVGATLEVTRTFANGWEVGVFATLTDVPFEDFGEGSFDKGFKISLPLSIFGGNTRSRVRTTIKPIQRDGGARLDGHGSTLWNQLRSTHNDRLQDTLYRLNQ